MRTAICLLALLLTACPSADDDDDFVGCVDEDGDEYCNTSDCDDADADVHPDAVEVCNDLDDDCDGELGLEERTDADGDGSSLCDDCNDDDGGIFPGNPEICDGFDNDCDGVAGDDEVDGDGDGHFACVDCDDETAEVAPGLEEVECDDRDTNCDGVLHEMEEDRDGDGFTGCDGDCGPDDSAIHPDADEGCNFVDNDCNGSPGPGETDGDNDGFLPCDDDCDDTNPGVSPGSPEICDGLDNDCNGLADALDADGNLETTDADGDGTTTCAGDCDDDDPTIAPGMPELCDGLDNNCDGNLTGVGPDGELETEDFDNDGSPDCVDCDDEDPAISPLEVEACDGLDTDCNGLVDGVDAAGDPEDTDVDLDTYSPCGGDCDDNDAAVNPDGYDLVTGGDGNCDGVIGAENPGFGPWTEPESDLLEFLEIECEDHGTTLATNGFEGGLIDTAIAELGFDGETEVPQGVGSLVYSQSYEGVSPRTGGDFARTEGPALSVTLTFDTPQTMVAVATQVFSPFIWHQYQAELYYQDTLISSGVYFATDDPGLDTWAFRGFLSLNDVPFDEIRFTAPGFEQWVFDDVWLCE